jgi:hypothetical protein
MTSPNRLNVRSGSVAGPPPTRRRGIPTRNGRPIHYLERGHRHGHSGLTQATQTDPPDPTMPVPPDNFSKLTLTVPLERLHILWHSLLPAHTTGREEVQPQHERIGVLPPGVPIPGEHPVRGEEPVHPAIRQPVQAEQERLARHPAVPAQQLRQPLSEPLRERISERGPSPRRVHEEDPPPGDTSGRDHRRKLASARCSTRNTTRRNNPNG